MPVFPSKRFRPTADNLPLSITDRIGILYRRKLASHPFLLFGLPFISLIVLSSFLLTPATALRYEKHDRTNREVSTTEALSLGLGRGGGAAGGGEGDAGEAVGPGGIKYNPRRRVITKGMTSQKDEYYKLMAKDLDDWEQKRVERWKGEPDGRM